MQNEYSVFIEPSSPAYYRNELFNERSKILNRDNCLAPFIYLKSFLESKGLKVFTSDYLLNQQQSEVKKVYISLGMLDNYRELALRKDTILSTLIVFEPPVVAPRLYRSLMETSKYFRHIFVHNMEVASSKLPNLVKYYWPQTENEVIEKYWSRVNRGFLTIINANKKPKQKTGELYSKRIKAISYFSGSGEVDLYGYGWDKRIFYLPYLLNRKAIMKCYKGAVASKYETLSRYNFALCFENMAMDGYITEKIFDCLFAGTIPVYLGDPNIGGAVPENCFIDMRRFTDYDSLRAYLHSLTEKDIERYRLNAKGYLESEQYDRFTKEYFASKLYRTILNDIEREV